MNPIQKANLASEERTQLTTLTSDLATATMPGQFSKAVGLADF